MCADPLPEWLVTRGRLKQEFRAVGFQGAKKSLPSREILSANPRGVDSPRRSKSTSNTTGACSRASHASCHSSAVASGANTAKSISDSRRARPKAREPNTFAPQTKGLSYKIPRIVFQSLFLRPKAMFNPIPSFEVFARPIPAMLRISIECGLRCARRVPHRGHGWLGCDPQSSKTTGPPPQQSK